MVFANFTLPDDPEQQFDEFDVYKGDFYIDVATITTHRSFRLPDGSLHRLDHLEDGAIGFMFIWCTIGVLGVCSVIFFTLSLRREQNRRRYHYISTAITTIATLAYYVMARGQGASARFDASLENSPFSPFRVFYWVRYVDWIITTPLLILNICLLAQASRALTLSLMTSDIIMIGTGIGASMSSGKSKWFWFGVSCFAFIPIVFSMLTVLRKAASERSGDAQFTYRIVLFITLATWVAFPILWTFAEGTHYISLDAEVAVYAVLDMISKGAMSFVLLLSKAAIEEATLKTSAHNIMLTFADTDTDELDTLAD